MGFPSRTEAMKFYFELRFSKYPNGQIGLELTLLPSFSGALKRTAPVAEGLPTQI